MKHNILIIDDNVKNIQLAANVLKQVAGYNVIFATSGSKGIEQLQKRDFHLILLDVHMPEIDGFETAKLIKADENLKAIPIIFISANATQDYIVKGFECGGADYIAKPFHETELLSRVKTHLELYAYRNHLEKQVGDSQSLLEQYKLAIDIANLVSKTDTKGKITYANDKFCKISGFTQEELLGKPHSIVRHQDMPSKAFEEMWDVIQEKEIWQGIVKNKAKDGSSYYVKSTVIPILDSADNIIEYMSVRTDITELEMLKQSIVETQRELLITLGEMVEARHSEAGSHVNRVALYSELLAKKCGRLSDEEVELLKMASPMHDIGKIAIEDSILLKPGKLTDAEFEIMKTHAQKGYDIFAKSQHSLLKAAAIIAHEHHEKWDGSGYPRGLKGDQIHIFGRITAIADVFDALSNKRVYKDAWSLNEVKEFMVSQSGISFDPIIIDIFLENFDEIVRIGEENKTGKK